MQVRDRCVFFFIKKELFTHLTFILLPVVRMTGRVLRPCTSENTVAQIELHEAKILQNWTRSPDQVFVIDLGPHGHVNYCYV